MKERLPFPLEGPVDKRLPDLENDRFVAVLSGVLPGLTPGRIVMLKHLLPVFLRIPHGEPEGVHPREAAFRSLFDLSVGTLKELLDRQRDNTIRAFETLLSIKINPDGSCEPARDAEGNIIEREDDPWTQNERFQEWLKTVNTARGWEPDPRPRLEADSRDPELLAREHKRRELFAEAGAPVPKCDPEMTPFLSALCRLGLPNHSPRQFLEQLRLYVEWLEEMNKYMTDKSLEQQELLASKHTGPVGQ